MDSIFWHDYETSGARPSLDRPLQFAGLRTNLDLEIIADPVMHYCRLPDDCLPSVDACLITGLTPQAVAEKGMSECAFMRRVHAELAQAKTCGAGYNSIRFDDEVTRYSLYRNFYDPYAREWQSGNSRWDIIDMVRTVYALRPDTLNWPEREPGIPSFKLENLSVANGLSHRQAHDALSDVEATIGLARLIKQRQPKLYDYCWKLRKKEFVAQQFGSAFAKPILHISSRFPATQGCAAIVLPLARMADNKNQIIVYDLIDDPRRLIDLSVDDIQRLVFSRTQDLESEEERLPLKQVHLNRSPVILPAKMLSEERAQELNIDLPQIQKHWQLAQQLPDLTRKLNSVFNRPFDAAGDVETRLYEGFLSNEDRALADRVRTATPEQLANESFPFEDERLQPLLFRYRARNFPNSLAPEEQQQWHEWVSEKLFLRDKTGLSAWQRYVNEIDARLNETHDAPQRALMQALADWGARLQREYSKA